PRGAEDGVPAGAGGRSRDRGRGECRRRGRGGRRRGGDLRCRHHLMAGTTSTIEIDRSPEDVFAYLDDPARTGEWQGAGGGAEARGRGKVDPEGPTKVGTRATRVLRMGRREMTMTYEIPEHDPPKAFAFRGLDGPVRPVGRGTVEPLDDGKRSRVTLELDFT